MEEGEEETRHSQEKEKKEPSNHSDTFLGPCMIVPSSDLFHVAPLHVNSTTIHNNVYPA